MKVSRHKKEARYTFFGRPVPVAYSYEEMRQRIIDIEDSRGRLPSVTAVITKKAFTLNLLQ